MRYVLAESELHHYLQRAQNHGPEVVKITQRALQLIRDQNFYYVDDQGWKSYSSQTNDPKQAYFVNGKCSCIAYTKGTKLDNNPGTFTARNQIYCKHRLGLNIYREILRNHLNIRLIGNSDQRHVQIRSKAHPWTYLTLVGDTQNAGSHRYGNDHIPTPICKVLGAQGQYRFANDQDAAQFAHWLARANPLPDNDKNANQAIYDEMRASGFNHTMAQFAAQASLCSDQRQLRTLWDKSGWEAFKSMWTPQTPQQAQPA